MMIEIDIPQLASSGIQLDENCFKNTIIVNSSSTYDSLSLPFDSSALEAVINLNSVNIKIDKTKVIPPDTADWIVGDGLYNKPFIQSWSIQNNTKLKHIVIGDKCFGGIQPLELSGLSELKSIVVGKYCFNRQARERRITICRFVDCPKLNSLQIGDGSFYCYHTLELKNLPSLHSIEMGGNCFYQGQYLLVSGFYCSVSSMSRSSRTPIYSAER